MFHNKLLILFRLKCLWFISFFLFYNKYFLFGLDYQILKVRNYNKHG